jgi:VWFA-related protein
MQTLMNFRFSRVALPLSAALFPLLVAAAAAQQTAGSGPVVSSAIGTIRLPVTVVDDHANPVKNLTAADLTLTDSDVKQTIQSFGPDPNQQLTFGIVAEAGDTLRTELGDERLATVHFIDHTLPGVSDQGFVVQYNTEVDLLTNPTAKANTLHDGANQIGSPQFGGNSGSPGAGLGGTLYDAIYLASREVIAKEPGRHVLILFTDGVDQGSKESMEDAIAAAQNANAAIFAIYFRGEEQQQRSPDRGMGRPGVGYPGSYPGGGYPGGRGNPGSGRRGGEQPERPHVDGKHILEQICNATGGYMVEGSRDKADKSYDKLLALLQHSYLITWKPGDKTADLAYHRLSLNTDKKNVWAIMQTGLTTGPQ